MKKTIIINFITALIFAANLSFAITQSQYDYWNGKLLSQPLSHQFAQLTNAPATTSINEFEWPEIVSKQYKSQLSSQEKQLNAKFRALSRSLLDKFDNYHKEIESSTDAEFSSKITPLIELRDEIAKKPSYVNYILVDHINRILVVNTAERLVKSTPLPPGIEEIVSNVCNFTVDVDIIKNIFEKENAQTYNLNSTNFPQKSKYERLWNKIEPETDYIYPKNTHLSLSYLMIDSENINLIPWRMMITAPYIASLPYVLEYRKKVSDYSPDNKFPKICQVMSKKRIESLPAIIKRLSFFSPASFVSKTMHRVRTGVIKDLLDYNMRKMLEDVRKEKL